MTMSKSMHTLLVEYAMLVDLKAHRHTLKHVTHSDIRIHAGEYYSDCNLYISNICEDHTHTHNN